MPDYEGLTPSEISLTRKIELLEDELRFYKNQYDRSAPVPMSEEPTTMVLDGLSNVMSLAIEAKIESDAMGYHIYARDYRNNYTMKYFVSDMDLNTHRYRVAEHFQHMLTEITMNLANDVMGKRA